MIYYKHRNKAKMDPNKYMCLIIDAMDQSKLMIPNLLRKSKAFSEAYKLKTHLTLVLDHGQTPQAFIDLFQWPHGPNQTMNILLEVLHKRNNLPDVLYLQCDNCTRENKNQFVLGFLAMLVSIGLFKKVRNGF